MGKCTIVAVIIAGLVAFYSWQISYYIDYLRDTEAPELTEQFWGPKSSENETEDESVRSFTISVDDDLLDDLRARLTLETSPNGNRLIPPLEGLGFQFGFNTDFLKNVTQHWLTKYDWRAREKKLNKYPQFKTTISGIEIHFQHIKSIGQKKYKKTRPLLMLHGWPGSFVEFQKIIPLLTDPKESDMNFELIIPSLPGYGFSERAHRPGLEPASIGQLFVKLLKRLGHDNFYINGIDWGYCIATDMAVIYPEHVKGIHLNTCIINHMRGFLRVGLAALYPTLFMDQDEAEQMYPISNYFANIVEESGHDHIQATKPDTIGVALSNSPSGLAAHVLEKFAIWTNSKGRSETNGGLLSRFELDELLDNVMVYWITNSITSSMRLYAEGFRFAQRDWRFNNAPVKVPTGCLHNKNELWALPAKWVLLDKLPQLVHFTKAESGHFGAFEAPVIHASDIVKFFNYIENEGLVDFN